MCIIELCYIILMLIFLLFKFYNRAAHAMADPEIQNILNDPVIRQVLQDFNENPNAANQAMMDPTVRSKIEKLVASGILQTG